MEASENVTKKKAPDPETHPTTRKITETYTLDRDSLMPILALLILATLSGYLFGLYRWSMLWPSLVFTGIYMVILRRVSRFMTYRKHAIERALARQQLDKHVETVEWLNYILERFWTVLEPAIVVRATDKINTLLENKCPGFLDSLELKEFTLGSAPPLVLSAIAYPQTGPEIIHLDVEVCFVPSEIDDDPRYKKDASVWNSKFVLAARIGKGILGIDVPIVVKEFSFYGKLRVQLELAPNLPFMNKIQLSFTEAPRIDFILRPLKSIDIMDLPGLSTWLMNTIDGVLGDFIVNPNVITIPLTRNYSDVHSIGVLRVTLRQIRGVKMGASILPCIKIQVGGRVKAISKQVDANTSEWNSIYYILVHSLRAPLLFIVMNGQSMIGSVPFSVQDIELNVEASTNVWRTIVGHESSKICGELNFGVEYFPAAEIPDPETDLNFESGIVQITLHQLKDIVHERDRKSLHCYYEIYVHDSDETIDPNDPPRIGKHHQSKPKKKTASPTWSEVFEVFLEHKDRTSITLLIRHALKEEQILGRWTAKFSSLINRTDWFRLENMESAQFSASFIFRPVRIDLSDLDKKVFIPSIGLLKLRIVSATGLRNNKAGYHVAVDINGRNVGKSKSSLPFASPVWNKNITTLVKDRKDMVHLELYYGDHGESYGSISCPISELLAHQNSDIERNEAFHDSRGVELTSRLRFTIGLYLIKRGEQTEDEVKDTGKNLVSSTGYDSNCGVLEIDSISVQGIHPTTTKSLHFCTLTMNDDDDDNNEVCYRTLLAKVDREHCIEWNRPVELFVSEPELLDLNFTIKETQGICEEFVDSARISFKYAQCDSWYKMEGITQGELKFSANYYPLPLILEPEINESGTLQIQVLDAKKLIAVDSSGTSDPFCVLRLNGAKFFKTKVIKKCLTPVFNELAEVSVKQRDASILQIELRDWNKVTASRTLGLVNIELQNLPPDQWEEMELSLENVSSGSLHFKIMFSPDQTGKKIRRSIDHTSSRASISAKDNSGDEIGISRNSESLELISEDEALQDDIENRLGESDGGTTSKSSESTDKRLASITTKAAGLKITIAELVINDDNSVPFDCKLKVKKDNITIFKTKQIKGKIEHRWNESFTIDSALMESQNKLTIVPTWSRKATIGEFQLELGQLDPSNDSKEHQVILPLLNSSLQGNLILNYSLTMDTMNMVDPKQHRRFSFLRLAK